MISLQNVTDKLRKSSIPFIIETDASHSIENIMRKAIKATEAWKKKILIKLVL